jgi:hypothetical protein
MSRSNLNRKTGKNDGYRVPYRGPSKYTQGVSTIRVQAPNTDGQVFVTVTLKPEDIEEIYSLYEANGRDIFKLFCYANESLFNNDPNEDPHWWGYIRYNTYRKNLVPKSTQETRDKFFRNNPETKEKYYSPPPQPQSYKTAWQNSQHSDAVDYRDYNEEEEGEDDYIPF